jgi:hypothetical protein
MGSSVTGLTFVDELAFGAQAESRLARIKTKMIQR